jgi:hypothetical protein
MPTTNIMDGGSRITLTFSFEIVVGMFFFFLIKVFVFWKIIFEKLIFKFFYICLLLEKLINGKYFSVKKKFVLISRKMFSFYFGQKTFFRSCEKFRNVILFSDYIKFGPQTFEWYIYIYWIFFFNFIP